MRLLRFDFRDDLHSVDLHPLITVVNDLPEAQQRQLFEAIRRLSTGSTVGLRGLVEHEGLMVELDAGAVDPLGPVTTDAAVLVYVDGVAVQPGLVGLQAEIDQWERQAAIDAAAVEEIRADLDLSIKAKAYGLRRATDPDWEPEHGIGASPRKLMIATIRHAYEEANGHEQQISDCDPAITDLLERWARYSTMHDQAEEHLFQIAAEVSRAETAVIDRSHDLDMAVLAARPVLLTVEQEARLEALSDASHAAVSSSRLWKRSLSDSDEAERQALLDLVDVKSWTEYSVYRMAPTVSADKLEAVSRAEAALAEAKAALDRAHSHEATDEVAARLHQELERIKIDSQPFLGVLVPSDIGAALEDQIVQIENPDWVCAMNNLRDALSSNDLHPPYGLEPDELLGWTDSWLRAQESLDNPATEDGADQDGSDRGGSTPGSDDESEAPRSPEELAEQVEAVNQQLVRHNRALAQIDKAERAAVRSALRVRELHQQLRARSSDPEITTAADVLALIAPIAEQILVDVGGSLPIAVVGDLAGLSPTEVVAMMGAIEEVAVQVQVIVVTGNEGVADWVAAAGLERAALATRTQSPV